MKLLVLEYLEQKVENEKKKTDYWKVVFSATVVGILPIMIKQLKDLLPFNINGTLLAVIFGAIGALIGLGIYSFVENKKIIYKILAYIILLLILIGGTVVITKFSSDSYVVKKEWKQIKNGNLSFEYPSKFAEINLGEKTENIEEMTSFCNKKQDRFAINMIFDFKSEPPAPENSLSGAILNVLENIKATEIEWIDSQFYEDAVTTKVKYKIGKNERIGFGIIYFKNWHYELGIFLPYTKDYSEEFLNKIINSVNVEE